MYDLKERFFILALIPDSLQMDVFFFFFYKYLEENRQWMCSQLIENHHVCAMEKDSSFLSSYCPHPHACG